MENLSNEQMVNCNAGYEDYWEGVAITACTIWGIGRGLGLLTISVVGSPLAGVIIGGILDVACAGVAFYDIMN